LYEKKSFLGDSHLEYTNSPTNFFVVGIRHLWHFCVIGNKNRPSGLSSSGGFSFGPPKLASSRCSLWAKSEAEETFSF